MTKKHYEAIANIIRLDLKSAGNHTRKENRIIEKMQCESIATQLADYFATDNPKFDRTRFLQACGISEICRHCSEHHNDGIMHICPENR